jgi:hypothetical protein
VFFAPFCGSQNPQNIPEVRNPRLSSFVCPPFDCQISASAPPARNRANDCRDSHERFPNLKRARILKNLPARFPCPEDGAPRAMKNADPPKSFRHSFLCVHSFAPQAGSCGVRLRDVPPLIFYLLPHRFIRETPEAFPKSRRFSEFFLVLKVSFGTQLRSTVSQAGCLRVGDTLLPNPPLTMRHSAQSRLQTSACRPGGSATLNFKSQISQATRAGRI